MKNAREEQNLKILNTLFETTVRVMDYVSAKNTDQSLFANIRKDDISPSENAQLIQDVIASIISKQIRRKFSI